MNSPVIQGRVEPDALVPQVYTQPGSIAAREFFNTMRHLVRRAGAYHSETELSSALASVDAFERAQIPVGDRARVVAETDPAPYEDVSLRRPPVNGLPVATSGSIDYAQLARAIVAEQARMMAEAQGTTPAEVSTQ